MENIRFYEGIFFGDDGMLHKVAKADVNNLDEYLSLCVEVAGGGKADMKCFKTRMFGFAHRRLFNQTVMLANGTVEKITGLGPDYFIDQQQKMHDFSDVIDFYHPKSTYNLTDDEINRLMRQIAPEKKLRQTAIEKLKGIAKKLYDKLSKLPDYTIETLQRVLPGDLAKYAHTNLHKMKPVFKQVDDRQTHIIIEYIIAELIDIAVQHSKAVFITPEAIDVVFTKDTALKKMNDGLTDGVRVYADGKEYTLKGGKMTQV